MTLYYRSINLMITGQLQSTDTMHEVRNEVTSNAIDLYLHIPLDKKG